MTKRLQDRIAIITGAGQGIGAAISRRFAAEGASVVGIDRDQAALDDLANEVTDFTSFPADVRDHQTLAACVEQTVANHGALHILVNNAGFQYTVPLGESTLEQWRTTQQINLEAHYVLCKLVAPHMTRAGCGRIVNISSTQSIAAEPSVSAYASSKSGVNGLTRSLAVELAPRGILVNAIAPGCIHTGMSIINGVDETTTDDFQDWYVKRRKIPLARPGQPDEIAAAALFLASDDCSYMTGHVLVVDGGLTITF